MRLAIITGGSAGLGAALVDEYLGRAWEVVELSRRAPLDVSVRVDLGDPLAAAGVFAEVFEPLRGDDLDEVVAVSNAAMLGPIGPLVRASAEAVEAHVQTNIVAAMLFARAFAAALQDAACPKSFVAVSSGAAVKGYAGWSLYGASKAAMDAFVRSFAAEQSAERHPIRAFSVNPGVMDTGMQAEIRRSSAEDFPQLERFRGFHREGRLAAPAAVARRIAEAVASRPEPGTIVDVSG